ncbi:hypothetical protein C5167_034190 [Papaver somniferum]|uniref:Uncharacterized protein n=1 Tax=Papaver somniferum TaxID=3469 RepID=A0A4Y7KG15_PAPSO|nr:hypothetical protein C5167_034190 [Papaver somniferum]
MASCNARRNPASLVLVMWLEEQTAVTLEAQGDWLRHQQKLHGRNSCSIRGLPMFLFVVHISCNSSGL